GLVMNLTNYIDDLQSRGVMTFTLAGALQATGITRVAFYNAVSRLKKAGRLITPRQGFYVIVRLEDRRAGGPPPSHYIHQLMEYLDKEYYIGLTSAAAMYGAAHQAAQILQVVTPSRMRPIRAGRASIQFIVNHNIDLVSTTLLKTPAGYVRVSIPEATAVDLVHYSKQAGGLDNVSDILIELSEEKELDPEKLFQASSRMHDRATAQRLGYLLDSSGFYPAVSILAGWLSKQKVTRIPLLASGRRNNVVHNRRWQVLINQELNPAVNRRTPA
ncbi:MAG: type IV toxin-antitoxin system AbiEi family antitoxin, partial [Candidatus Auribacterota bacterium]|nr:type IV toxin-antitoxin system AbiEi family antitoxin [Candidatus Auribacterota bacterium]